MKLSKGQIFYYSIVGFIWGLILISYVPEITSPLDVLKMIGLSVVIFVIADILEALYKIRKDVK